MKLSTVSFLLLVAFFLLTEVPSSLAKGGGGGKGGGAGAKPAAPAPAKADGGNSKPAAKNNNSNHDPSCDECQPCHHRRSVELLEMWDETQMIRRGTIWDDALHQRGREGGLNPSLEHLLARAFQEDGETETTLFKRIPPSDGGAALVNAIAATIRRKQHTCTGCTLRPILGSLSSKFCFSYGGGFRKRSLHDELEPPIDHQGTSYPHIAAVHDAVAFLRRENGM